MLLSKQKPENAVNRQAFRITRDRVLAHHSLSDVFLLAAADDEGDEPVHKRQQRDHAHEQEPEPANRGLEVGPEITVGTVVVIIWYRGSMMVPNRYHPDTVGRR